MSRISRTKAKIEAALEKHGLYRKLKKRWAKRVRKAKAKLKQLRADRDARREQNAGRVSAHFQIDEFKCRDGTPAPKANRRAIERLARQVLEPLRDQFGPCHINSAYRHRAYNASIGGATQSYHIYDLRPTCAATDVTFARGNPAQWAQAARKLGKGGVGQYDRSGFIHVDNGPRRDWWG